MKIFALTLAVVTLIGLAVVPSMMPRADEHDDLTDTMWELVTLGGESVVDGAVITIEFDADGGVFGRSGCNNYGGEYTTDGDVLSLGDVFVTEMACMDDDIMAQEMTFLAALSSVTTYELSGDELIINYGDGDEQMVFAPLLNIIGTEWSLVTFGGDPIIENTTVTLGFGDDNRAFGSAGCNSYGGPFMVNGDAINFGMMVSTLMACLDDGIMEQETEFLRALNDVTRFTITDGQLIVYYGADDDEMVFERIYRLNGTEWELASIDGETASEETTVTLEFIEAGQVGGSGGCNSYNSVYTQDGDTINFGMVASTRMACANDIMAQESAYFAALQDATHFELRGNTLTIFYGEEDAELIFERVLLDPDTPVSSTSNDSD